MTKQMCDHVHHEKLIKTTRRIFFYKNCKYCDRKLCNNCKIDHYTICPSKEFLKKYYCIGPNHDTHSKKVDNKFIPRKYCNTCKFNWCDLCNSDHNKMCTVITETCHNYFHNNDFNIIKKCEECNTAFCTNCINIHQEYDHPVTFFK
jgi:hypothetical protein